MTEMTTMRDDDEGGDDDDNKKSDVKMEHLFRTFRFVAVCWSGVLANVQFGYLETTCGPGRQPGLRDTSGYTLRNNGARLLSPHVPRGNDMHPYGSTQLSGARFCRRVHRIRHAGTASQLGRMVHKKDAGKRTRGDDYQRGGRRLFLRSHLSRPAQGEREGERGGCGGLGSRGDGFQFPARKLSRPVARVCVVSVVTYHAAIMFICVVFCLQA